MKNLPIGIQSFADIRNKNYLYIDKTENIYRLISTGKIYFLSRPRRFGKSLLVSTLEEIFKGNKSLFEGLYIYDKWDWEQQYPVIRLDYSGLGLKTPEELKLSLSLFVSAIAKEHQLSLSEGPTPYRFAELIDKLHQSTGQQVVVLVDEYDKPITDNLSNPDIIDAHRRILHDFYQVLKASDEHLRFLFLTGVSKFSGVSVFSVLNNLDDITLNEKQALICGYTQEELEHYFSEYIDDVAEHVAMSREALLDEIRVWYDGYSWDGKTPVYNPFSTLLFFSNREFANYWFRTGTPTFLIDLLKKRNRIESLLEPVVTNARAFDSYDPLRISEMPLLFQTGYLTIKRKELIVGRPQYMLDIPNAEVKESLLEYLLSAYLDYPVDEASNLIEKMRDQLIAHNTEGLEQSLREMLSYIPYQLQVKTEAYYHSMLLLWLKLLGFNLIAEIPTNIGRIDAVWTFPGHVIVVEVKYKPGRTDIYKLLDAAIKQIRETRYYERFVNERKVSLLGVAFTGNKIGCRIEDL